MNTLRTVGGLERTETAHDSFQWSSGERPDWWISHALTWEFELPNGRRFATSNLDQAVSHLSERLRKLMREVRLALFLTVPITIGEQASLRFDGVTVTVHPRNPYLRQQVERLIQLQRFVDDYRRGVVGDVLATFTIAADEGLHSVEQLLDPHDSSFYLGVDLRTLDSWSREFNAYEVQSFVREYTAKERERRPAAIKQQSTERSPDQEHEALVKRYSEAITRFIGYFDAPDFEPRGEHEQRALALHRKVRSAATAAEEERLTIERDRYLADFVL